MPGRRRRPEGVPVEDGHAAAAGVGWGMDLIRRRVKVNILFPAAELAAAKAEAARRGLSLNRLAVEAVKREARHAARRKRDRTS